MCKPVTYHGVSAQVFECLKKKLEEAGVKVPPGDSGKISAHGIEAEFRWDEESETLWIKIIKKPFFLSCGFIYGKIHDAVESCGGE